MRKFALVVFDIDNSITDRFPLDLVTGLSGLGWRLKLSKIEGDVTDTLTKVVQEKQPIGITINMIGRGYEKFFLLTQWVQKYSFADKRLALEYSDGVRVQYTEGKLTELKKGEKNEYNNLVCAATFTPLTPFFTTEENVIRIERSAKGKCYSFKYPYCYGKEEVTNNTVENPYLSDIPITVTVYGGVTSPTVQLLDEEGNSYCRVQFSGLTLASGQYLVINSSMQKIYFFDGLTLQDYSAEPDPEYDTFLFAKSGTSKVSINLEGEDTGYLVGSWRQYSL